MLLLKIGVLEGKKPVNYDYRTRELAAVSLNTFRHFCNHTIMENLLQRSQDPGSMFKVDAEEHASSCPISCSANVLDLYSAGVHFEPRSVHMLSQ